MSSIDIFIINITPNSDHFVECVHNITTNDTFDFSRFAYKGQYLSTVSGEMTTEDIEYMENFTNYCMEKMSDHTSDFDCPNKFPMICYNKQIIFSLIGYNPKCIYGVNSIKSDVQKCINLLNNYTKSEYTHLPFMDNWENDVIGKCVESLISDIVFFTSTSTCEINLTRNQDEIKPKKGLQSLMTHINKSLKEFIEEGFVFADPDEFTVNIISEMMSFVIQTTNPILSVLAQEDYVKIRKEQSEQFKTNIRDYIIQTTRPQKYNILTELV